MTNIKEGQTLFYLYRGTYNPNAKDELIIPMLIVNKDGELHAVSQSKTVHWINFEITDEIIDKLDEVLFLTEHAALAKYEEEFLKWKENLMALPKEEIIEKLYNAWVHLDTGIKDVREYDAMKEKIKRDFNVEIKN